MALQELTQQEVEEVVGAGIIGSTIQAGSNLVSGFFNGVAPIGKLVSLVPGVGIAHYIGDSIIQAGTDTAYKVGSQLGGQLPQEKMHLNQEIADGTYNPLGFLKFFK